jgi:hypothetical protein
MQKFWKVTPAEVAAIAKERASRLRAHSFCEISAFPTGAPEDVKVGDQIVNVYTYRHDLPDGRVRVVVQAYRYRLLGVGTMTADGFIMSPDGSLSDIPREMMYEFI